MQSRMAAFTDYSFFKTRNQCFHKKEFLMQGILSSVKGIKKTDVPAAGFAVVLFPI